MTSRPKKRKWDWPSVAALAVILAAVVATMRWVEVDRVKDWLDALPTLVMAGAAFFLASRGRATELVALLTHERAPERERASTPPPPSDNS